MLDGTDLEFLRGLSIFAGLPADVLDTIAAHARRVELTAGEVLFVEGEPAKDLLVVRQGMLEVVKRPSRGGEVCIAALSAGDVAGEMSLLDIQPRSAAVRAADTAIVIVIGHGDLAGIYREDKASYTLLVMNIAREISLRLRRVDTVLANIMAEIGTVTGTSGRALDADEEALLTEPRDVRGD